MDEEYVDVAVEEVDADTQTEGGALVPIRSDLPQGINSDTLEEMLEEERKRRLIIDKYISSSLVKGTDYDVIPGCGNKPTLLLPGAERIISLFGLTPKFDTATDILDSMTPAMRENVVACVRCKLIDKNGIVVGEGIGMSEEKEKSSWTKNMATKICYKRAQVDAAKRIACVSDRFTQDVEDMPKKTADNVTNRKPARVNGNAVNPSPIEEMSDEQKKVRGKVLGRMKQFKNELPQEQWHAALKEIREKCGTTMVKDMSHFQRLDALEVLDFIADEYGLGGTDE